MDAGRPAGLPPDIRSERHMTKTSFGFSQADDGTTRIARVCVPGTGRNERDDAPIIMVEIEKSGDMKLLVYADILSREATHEIPLNGALLANKTREEELSGVGKAAE